MDEFEQEIREEIGSLTQEMQGIIDAAKKEKRDLTGEEDTRFTELETEIEDKQKELKRYQERKERLNGIKEFGKGTQAKSLAKIESEPEVGGDMAPSWMRRAVRYFNALAIGKDDSTKSQDLIGELKREVTQMSSRQHRDEHKEAAKIIDGSPLSSVKKYALKSALEIEERLHTTSTTDTPKAGFLLPKPFLAEVFVIVEQYSLARRLFRTIPMISKDIDLKNVAQKVVSAWASEGSNIVASDLVLSEQKLEVEKLAGLTSWTSELEEDQAIALLPIVQELFGESIGEKEDQAAFLGDGSSSYGGFTGLLNLSGAEEISFETGTTTAEGLDEAALRQAKNALSEARQSGARWIMHRTVQEEIAQFENGAGYRVFQEMINGSTPNQLLGFPIETSEVMPSFGSVTEPETPFIILGNPNRALMGMRRGLTADISRDAVIQDAEGDIVYNAFQADGALLRLTERVGFKVPTAYESAFAVITTGEAE